MRLCFCLLCICLNSFTTARTVRSSKMALLCLFVQSTTPPCSLRLYCDVLRHEPIKWKTTQDRYRASRRSFLFFPPLWFRYESTSSATSTIFVARPPLYPSCMVKNKNNSLPITASVGWNRVSAAKYRGYCRRRNRHCQKDCALDKEGGDHCKSQLLSHQIIAQIKEPIDNCNAFLLLTLVCTLQLCGMPALLSTFRLTAAVGGGVPGTKTDSPECCN